ncbi:MAG: hypothetical protein NTW28_33110 [Candidatus Solibacter sp.]|nr:hypothetical protein [Candidatus Solibacter sp.]
MRCPLASTRRPTIAPTPFVPMVNIPGATASTVIVPERFLPESRTTVTVAFPAAMPSGTTRLICCGET